MACAAWRARARRGREHEEQHEHEQRRGSRHAERGQVTVAAAREAATATRDATSFSPRAKYFMARACSGVHIQVTRLGGRGAEADWRPNDDVVGFEGRGNCTKGSYWACGRRRRRRRRVGGNGGRRIRSGSTSGGVGSGTSGGGTSGCGGSRRGRCTGTGGQAGRQEAGHARVNLGRPRLERAQCVDACCCCCAGACCCCRAGGCCHRAQRRQEEACSHPDQGPGG